MIDLQAIRIWLWELFHLVWKDKIQENANRWGFDSISTANPGMVEVTPDDANGVNLSRVPDPAGGPGFCLRHYADLSHLGAYVRSQAGVYGSNHSSINTAADKGCCFEHECFLPKVLSANGDPFSWLSLQDIHVVDGNQGNRSYLGLLVEQDGSMRVRLGWGGLLYAVNRDAGLNPPISRIPLPVGRWFKIKTYFKRSTEPTTIKVWFDDQLAMEWDGAINSLPSNERTEYYVKLYGGVQRDNPWGKVERYSRNARIYK